jgi:hypothetical protein
MISRRLFWMFGVCIGAMSWAGCSGNDDPVSGEPAEIFKSKVARRKDPDEILNEKALKARAARAAKGVR